MKTPPPKVIEFQPYDPAMKEFARRLRAVRIEKGLAQNDLARIAKLHPMQVSKYERGERAPSAANLVSLAEALGVTVEYLMDGNAPPGAGNGKEIYRFPLLLDRAKQVDQELDRKDVESIISLLDAYLAKNRIKKLVNE